MSGIIFKVNKPLTLKSGTGVILDRNGIVFRATAPTILFYY